MEHLPEFIANHLFLVSLLAGILMLLLWNLFGNSLSGIQQVTPLEATRMMNHEKALMLDIRNEKDFHNGHILNAMHIPAEQLAERIDSLEKYRKRPIIISCRQGTDSSRAARVLKNNACENIYCLKGGVQAWRSANLPLAREQDRKEST
ncbi:MAG TPA: rhodanese-like domain-containing protein [Gammaproteobacteria bacterium]|nr:rhodanese-like domain-containing protein [Gammaproteobacteria bacterium]